MKEQRLVPESNQPRWFQVQWTKILLYTAPFVSFWKLFKRQGRSMLVVNLSTALVTSQSSGRTSLVAFPKGSLICAWSAIMVNLLKLTLSSHARGKGPAAGQPGDLTVVWAVPFQVSVMLMSGKKQKQWHFRFGGLESDNEKNGKKGKFGEDWQSEQVTHSCTICR